MGAKGPVPKRESQRRRVNKPEVPIVRAKAAKSVVVPDPDETWHPLAVDWFRSLADSGQTAFYEPSDWQTARYVAEAMTRSLSTEKFSPGLFAGVLSAMGLLLTTEGDRRRLRIELDRTIEDEDEEAAVSALDDYRNRLSV